MGNSSKDKRLFDDIIRRENLSSKESSNLYEKALKHTPFVFSDKSQKTHDLYSVREDVVEIYHDELVRNIFEVPEIFKYFLYAINDPEKKYLGRVNAYNYSSDRYRSCNIAGLVTIAMDMYADTKDSKLKARVGQAFKNLDGNKNPIIKGIKEGRITPEGVKSLSPEQVLMLSQSLGSLDDVVIDPSIKNGIIPKILDELDEYYSEHKGYYINGNLDTMLSTKSEIGSKFTLSRALHDEILKNMPSEVNGRPISEMEIADYIYTRMCQVLRYDPLYTYNSELGIAQHSSPLKLSTIWPGSPILCYEFSYLYSKFLEEFGIEHAIVYGNNSVTTDKLIHGTLETEQKRKEKQGEKDGYYSNGHTFCIVRAKHTDGLKHTFVADSTRSGVSWDLDTLKTSTIDPRAYTGLQPLDTGNGINSELVILREVIENIARIVSSEHNQVRVNDICNCFPKYVEIQDLSIEQKQQMIREILTRANWADDPTYFKNMKDILSQFGVDFEFVIGKVQNYYEVNVLVGYDIDGKKQFDYAYPPGEFETLSLEQVREKYEEGSIISKQERMRDSKLLRSIFQTNNSNMDHNDGSR